MDLLDIHNSIRKDLGKDKVGYVSPEAIDDALDRAQIKELRYLIGEIRPNRDGPEAYTSRQVEEALAPFWVTYEVSTELYDPIGEPFGSGPNGVIVLPDDFEHLDGIRIDYSNAKRRIVMVTESEIGDILGSELVAPTGSYPYGVLTTYPDTVNAFDVTGKKKIQVYPKDELEAVVRYIRRPATPLLSYTLVGRALTYSAILSTQMEWGDQSIDRIISRAASILSKEIHRRDIAGQELQENSV